MSGKIVEANTYVHIQSSASTTWAVPHGLVKNSLVVDVWIDLEGTVTKVSPQSVDIIDPYNCEIHFSEPLAGKALIV